MPDEESPAYTSLLSRINAHEMWDTMTAYERLPVILDTFPALDWFAGHALPTLAHFRTVPTGKWGQIKARFKSIGGNPYDLEQAVDSLLALAQRNGSVHEFPSPQPATTLLAQTFPPLRMFVNDLLAEGLTLLAGKPKKGKSYLALDMCLSIAVGRTAFWHFPTERANVLYVSLEDGERRIQRRLTAIQSNLATPSNPDFLYSFPRLGDGALEALTHYAETYQVIVIDVLGRILPPQTAARKSLSEYQELTDALGPIQRMAQDKRLAILLIDHVRKAAAEDAGDAIMGSQGKFGVADHALIWERKGNEKDGALQVLSRDLEEEKFILSMVNGHLEFLGKGEIYELESEQNRVIKAMEEEGKPMAVADVMKAMGVNPTEYPRFRKMLYRLYEEDRIGRNKRGLYRVYREDREDGVPF